MSFPIANLFSADGYSSNQIPDLQRKVFIVTGGTSGLGYATVEELYRHNGHVILTARTVAKGEEAKSQIIAAVAANPSPSNYPPLGEIQVEELDLSSLASVAKFGAKFKYSDSHLKIHCLVLNAGIMACPFSLSKDGIEMQFAVNHVAHQFLTSLLLDNLRAASPSRIVSLSSALHKSAPAYGVGTSLAEINNEATYSPFAAYGQSKLANILFAKHLAKLVEKDNIFVNAVHPGVVKTGLQRSMVEGGVVPPFVAALAPAFMNVFAYDPKRACLTQVYLATSPDVEEKKITGQYYGPIAKLATRLDHAQAENADLQRKLYEFTEQLIRDKAPHS